MLCHTALGISILTFFFFFKKDFILYSRFWVIEQVHRKYREFPCTFFPLHPAGSPDSNIYGWDPCDNRGLNIHTINASLNPQFRFGSLLVPQFPGLFILTAGARHTFPRLPKSSVQWLLRPGRLPQTHCPLGLGPAGHGPRSGLCSGAWQPTDLSILLAVPQLCSLSGRWPGARPAGHSYRGPQTHSLRASPELGAGAALRGAVS